MLRDIVFCIGVALIAIGLCHAGLSNISFENKLGGALKALTTELRKSDWVELAKSWLIGVLLVIIGIVLVISFI